jgi:hypothetical protein
MRAAIIHEGLVENIILTGEDFVPEEGRTLVDIDDGATISIGWKYEAGEFIEQPAFVPVPEAVTARQARLAMLNAGLLAIVEKAVDEMTGVEGDAVRIEWDYATEIRRRSNLMSAIATALSLTETAVDDLFRDAKYL